MAPLTQPEGSSTANTRTTLERGFWIVAASIVVIVLGANTALPILTVYQANWHFSTGMLSVVYGLYTVGVLAAVFLVGPASDLVGRKRVLVPAMMTMALGLAIGLIAPNLWVLMASRILQGMAVGAGVTTAMAALGELHPDPRDHGRIALTATVTTVGGLAGGPLVAGSLAEFAPYPTQLPYIVALAMTIAIIVAMMIVPETVVERRPFRLQSVAVSVPPSSASAFALAIFVAVTAYAVAGTFAGLGSSFARDLLRISSHFLAGLVIALLFLCSAGAQILGRNWPLKSCITVGLGLLALGLAVFTLAIALSSATALFTTVVLLGAGHGLSYLGAQELTDRIAPPDRRAQMFSALQLGLYGGATVPAVVVGFAAGDLGLAPATLGFCAVVVLLCFGGLAWVRASRTPALNA